MTRLEVETANDRRIMRQHIASSAQLHQDNRTLIDGLDKRMDRQDLRFAWATGVIATVVFLANIFGPVISRALERAIN